MGNLSIICCQPNKDDEIGNNNFFKKTLRNLICRRKIKIIGKLSFTVRLYNSMVVDVTYLPFKFSELFYLNENTLRKIGEKIARICEEKGIKECILSKELYQLKDLCNPLINLFPKKYIYRCTFTNILDMICNRRNMNGVNIDTVILRSEDNKLFSSILRLLSSRSKYITVVVENSDEIEEDINEIYEETGLSIRTTGDFKNGMKSADIIINLMKDAKLIEQAKIPQNAIILNYGEGNLSDLMIENPVINGIDVGLPKYVVGELGEDLLRHFEAITIAESILKHRADIEESIDFSDYRIFNKISAAFNNDGYRIRGFIGRRNVFKLD